MTMRGEFIASTRSERGGLTSAGALSFAGGKLCERTRLASANALWRGLECIGRCGHTPGTFSTLGSMRRSANSATAPASTASVSRASYHAGRFLQPRSPKRKVYFPEDGTIYFHPTPARWEGLAIQPKVAEVIEGGDVLRELVRRRDAGGLKVCCWTVCLHNTRLGMLHPGAVTRNAFGDPNYYNLCPSNPDARAYVVRSCRRPDPLLRAGSRRTREPVLHGIRSWVSITTRTASA